MPAPVTLLEALGVTPGTLVALAGAGGKTSLLWALAREAAERWGPGRVLHSTTTRMYEPAAADIPPLGDAVTRPPLGFQVVDAEHGSQWASGGGQRPHEGSAVAVPAGGTAVRVLSGGLVSTGATERPKLTGVPPAWLDEVHRRNPEAVIIVEADGAARRPLKAPGEGEPVFPATTGLVLAVAGLDVLGHPLDGTFVHRPEAVAKLTGQAPGTPVTPSTVALALWHPEGCGRGRPSAAELVPVLNKADGPRGLQAARAVARELIALGAPKVLCTSCLHWPVVREVIQD